MNPSQAPLAHTNDNSILTWQIDLCQQDLHVFLQRPNPMMFVELFFTAADRDDRRISQLATVLRGLLPQHIHFRIYAHHYPTISILMDIFQTNLGQSGPRFSSSSCSKTESLRNKWQRLSYGLDALPVTQSTVSNNWPTGFNHGLLMEEALLLFMVALWNRADHYIFILSFVLSIFFFRHLISAATDWMSAILPHMVWLSLKPAARGSLKTQDAKKSSKIAIWAPLHNFVRLYLRN